MAYSAADLAADDITLAAADKTMICPQMIVAPNGSEWSAAGSFAGADASASGFPAARAYDGFTDLVTKPSSAAVTWYYLLDFSVTPIDIDFCAIMGHNFGTITGLTVTLEIADDSAFTTNLIEIASFSPASSNNRLIDLVLETGGGTARKYSTVPYARIVITGTSGTPEIGELILGERLQMQYKPNRPYNPDQVSAESEQFRTKSGIVTTYIHNRGARSVNASLVVSGTTKIADVNAFWTNTRHGTLPFLWVENPNSTPASYNLMTFEDGYELEFLEVGPNHRELGISAIEQGPDFLALQ